MSHDLVGILYGLPELIENQKEKNYPIHHVSHFPTGLEIALYGFNLLIVPIMRTMIDFLSESQIGSQIQFVGLFLGELIAFS
ncbi:MAG: hypothetical protein Ct9H90mP11_01920 [Acidimicrobiales bacterium]|nr:MAG: hypothetical protein Ct9H90mP11_01920 [Acidimicrobiales bacterium]